MVRTCRLLLALALLLPSLVVWSSAAAGQTADSATVEMYDAEPSLSPGSVEVPFRLAIDKASGLRRRDPVYMNIDIAVDGQPLADEAITVAGAAAYLEVADAQGRLHVRPTWYYGWKEVTAPGGVDLSLIFAPPDGQIDITVQVVLEGDPPTALSQPATTTFRAAGGALVDERAEATLVAFGLPEPSPYDETVMVTPGTVTIAPTDGEDENAATQLVFDVTVDGSPLTDTAVNIAAVGVIGQVTDAQGRVQVAPTFLGSRDELTSPDGVDFTFYFAPPVGQIEITAQVVLEGDPSTPLSPPATTTFTVGPPAVTEAAKVLSESQRAAVTAVEDSSVTFDANAADVGDIAVGDVLVSAPAPNAPDGMLRRVTALNRSGDVIRAETVGAAITEAVANGSGGTTTPLGPNDVGSVETVDGVAPSKGLEGTGAASAMSADPIGVETISLALDTVLHDADGDASTTGDRVTVTGTLALALTLDTALEISDREVDRFRFAVGVEEQLDAAFTVGEGAPGDWERQLAQIFLRPITFTVGPVPVVLTPEVRVSVGANRETTVAVDFSTTSTRSAQLGAEYTADGGWSNISGPQSTAVGSATPPASGAATVREGFVKDTVALEFYGAAGPNVFTTRTLQLHSQPDAAPIHELTLRDRSGVGVALNLPFLGDVAGHDAVLHETVTQLWTHGEPQPDHTEPPADPPPGAPIPENDIVAHRVVFDDQVRLGMRLAAPTDPITWAQHEYRRVHWVPTWRIDARSGEDKAFLFVRIDAAHSIGGRPTVRRFFQNSASGVCVDIYETDWFFPTFDGTWIEVTLPPSCLQHWLISVPPDELRVRAEFIHFPVFYGGEGQPDEQYDYAIVDSVPAGASLDDPWAGPYDGPVASGDQATFLDEAPEVPAWASGEDVPTTGPAAALFPPDFDRFGGLTQDEFFRRWWDSDAGNWRWPPNEGAEGTVSPNTLGVGDVIDRFGGPGGQYASPFGSSYPSRSIPPSNVGREYHIYRVDKPLPETVRESDVAPWFEMPGGGTQYVFEPDRGLQYYITNGYLTEVTSEYQ